MALNATATTEPTPLPFDVVDCGKTGKGWVAKKRIEKGERILWEEVLVSETTFQALGGLHPLYNKYIGQRLKAVGDPQLKREFFTLPSLSKEPWGAFAAIFEKNAIPAPLWDGYKGRVVGLLAAYLNHSCLPNSQQTWCRDPSKPKQNFLAVHACRDIEEGEEITVSYENLYCDMTTRRQWLLQEHHFVCLCPICENQDPAFEAGLELMFLKIPIVCTEYAINTEPAGVLQMAKTVLEMHESAGLTDHRYARLWEHCAMVCIFHSDVARATVFYTRAQNAYLTVQGALGEDYLRLKQLAMNPMTHVQAARTQKGLSTKSEADIIWKSGDRLFQILFMFDAKDLGDYVKVSEYQDLVVGKQEGELELITPKVDIEETAKVDIEKLVRELDLEKKEHDEYRRQRSSSSDEKATKAKGKGGRKSKKKGKGKGKKNGNGNEQDEAVEALETQLQS